MSDIKNYDISSSFSNRLANNEKNNSKIQVANPKKSKLNFILLIIGIVIIMAFAIFLIIYLKSKNNKTEENKNETLEEDRNYIIATYQVKEGQEVKAFNPSSVGLSEDDYSIYEIEESSNTLRLLKEIQKKNEQVVSKKDGLMKLKIKFHKNLTNLDYMFESCEDLINIDMSHVEASNIISMIYAFTGCKKMEKINLTSINTTSVKLMDFLFAGCNSLTDISGLETLNTSSLKKTAGMFLDCNNLVFANLSSFQINNVEEQNGMFINNPNLKVVDLSNCSDANQIFSHEEYFDIVIIGIDEINVDNLNGSIQKETEIEEINCTIGSKEKCLECSSKKGEKINCKSCNDGYYLPLGNSFTKTKCKKCDEGCNICYANPGEDLSICTLCNDTYQLYEGKCILNCEIGEDEKCSECGDGKQGFNDRCQKCNPGYYYDINYNKSICKKIDIDNCIEAEMESNNLRCLKCSKGFMVYENLCFKSCDEGENEKCSSCNNNFDYREYCATCNSGYYRNDINPTKCESCFKNISYTYNNTYYYNDNYSDLFLETDEKYLNIKKSLINGTLDNYLYNIFAYKADFFVKDDNNTYQITTTNNQKLNKYEEISVISLGECENILMEIYSIEKNKSIIILKVDTNREGLSMPIVHFEVFHPVTKNKLDLSFCKDIKMNIIFNYTMYKIETNNCKECDLISGKLICTFCKEGYVLINNTCFKDCDKGCENCYFDGKNNGRCMKCKEEYLLNNNYSYCIPCPTGCKYCYDKYQNPNNSNYQNCTNNPNCTDYADYTSHIDYEEEKFYEEKEINYRDNDDDINFPDSNVDINFTNYNGDINYKEYEEEKFYEEKEINYRDNDDDINFPDSDVDINFTNYDNDTNYIEYEEEMEEYIEEENYIDFDIDINYTDYADYRRHLRKLNYNSDIYFSDYVDKGNYNNHSDYINNSSALDYEDNKYCTSCIEGYNLLNNLCIKQCDIGKEEKCLKCETNRTNRCSLCNPKYYLDIFSGTCHKCQENNCLKCDNKTCFVCDIGYELISNKCYKTCEKGKNEKCRECQNIISNNKGECSSCNEGYYLPNNSADKSKCSPCSFACLSCYGNKTTSICTSCKDNFKLYGGKCKINYNDSTEENECPLPYISSGGFCMEKCSIGTNDKCYSCNNEELKIDQCKECNIGYFLPADTDKKKCELCGAYCLRCEGTKLNNKCLECQNNYMLSDGRCVKNCEIGNNDKCKKCLEKPGINYRCEICNDGYYLPELSSDINYHNSKCQKCPEDCKICSGKYNEPICIKCNDGYILLKEGKCIEGCPIIKLKNNCKECREYDEDNNPDPKCTECLDGYFFPDGMNKCYKCNDLGCNKCKGNINNNTCTECDINLSPIKINNEIKSCYNICEVGDNEKCKSCSNEPNKCHSCNEGYELKDGICNLKYYTFSAIYITTYKNEQVKLMNSYNTIVKMEVDGKIYNYPYKYFTFENPGEHTVNIRLGGYSFADLFCNIKKLKSITFWDNFDSTKINLMNDFFAFCDDLEYADLSRLNLKNNKCFMNFFKNDAKLKEVKFPIIDFHNIYWFYGMFEGCESITSVDLSNAYNDNGQYFFNMFKGCKSLKKINLKNFRKKVNPHYDAYEMFIGVPENGEIIIHHNFEESIKEQIPKTWIIKKE